MITTSETVIINQRIPLGAITTYTTSNVSLFIKSNGVQKRFNPTGVINATVSSTGIIIFGGIPLWGDGSYSLYITAENNSDLDVGGVNLTRLGSGFIKKITNTDVLYV